jgi:hypothetical protein
MTVHINDFIKYIGRKPISGDVIELPHLKDDFALNDFDITLPRYYVIEDVGRASEGFSVTWFPHLYRLKLKKIVDNQQYGDILNQKALDANGNPMDNTTLRDLLSTHSKELEINDQIVAQAEADSAKSGYETRQFYTLNVDGQGKTILETTDQSTLDASNLNNKINASSTIDNVPPRTGYTGYLVGDGYPINGYDFGFGIQFPEAPTQNDFFLRTDFLPNRLFRFDSTRWVKVEDAVRMNMTNNDTRNTLKTGFINNTTWTYNEEIGTDIVKATAGDIVVNTSIAYTTSLYVVLKYNNILLQYSTVDYPSLLSSYSYLNPKTGITYAAVRINLPYIAPGSAIEAGTAATVYDPTTGSSLSGGHAGASFNPSQDVAIDDTAQQTIPITGTWNITMYNYREEQRQSLSKALRPKADF